MKLRFRRFISRGVILGIALTALPIVVPEVAPSASANGDGLFAFYRNETRSSGDKDLINSATVETCNSGKLTSTSIDWGSSAPSGCNGDNFSGYFTGYILGPKTGVVNFSGSADDSLVLRIDSKTVFSNFGTPVAQSGTFSFTEGVVYPIQIFFGEFAGAAAFNITWDGLGASAAITSSHLASTPAPLLSSQYQTADCQVGYSASCPAYSPQEIYNLYGTVADGNYWILIGGAPSYQYVLLSRSFDNGGWVLAMKGNDTTSKFAFSDTYYWEQPTVENVSSVEDLSTYTPARLSSDGTGTDAKYDSFNGIYAERIRAVFPEYSASSYGGRYTTNNSYGFMWEESLSSLQNGAATYNTGSGQNGESLNCTGITTTTLLNLFKNSKRCLFRTPDQSYNASDNNSTSYDPIGNGLFGSQSVFKWWGINYRQATGAASNARFGFGWNENGVGDEGSNDVTGGIGLSISSRTTGNQTNCCSVQTGISAQFAFELYVRQANPSLNTPQSLSVTSLSSTSANLSWSAPAATTPTEYVVQYKTTSAQWTTGTKTVRILDPGSSPTAQITGLTANTSYDFRVFARTLDTTTRLLNTNSSASSATATKTMQSITFTSLANKTLGMDSFTVTASASSGLAVTLASTTLSVCTISGTRVTLVSQGTCTITANQSGDSTYAAATEVSRSFTISPTLTIATPSAGLAAVYDSAYALSLVSSGGSGGNSFALASGSLPAGLSLNSSTGAISGTPSAAGSSSLTVRVTDSNTATATTSSFTITVALANQSPLAITSSSVTYGETLAVVVTGGSGSGTLSVTVDSGSCTMSGLVLTPTSAGSCLIRATKAASTNYLETTTTRSITINQRTLTVKAIDRTATYTGSPAAISNSFSITAGTLATSESITSLTYTYTSIPSGSYSSTTAPTAGGSYTITPSAASFSPGSASNYAISYETATLTIARASQSTLTITSTTAPYGQSLSLTTSGGSGTGSVSYLVNSGNCTISTATLTSSSTGSCSVTATKAADSNYLAESTTATITITTGSATATIAFASTTMTFGITNAITVTVSTAGTVRFSANGKVIRNCKAVETITSGSITATCSYRPATRRPLTITARLTPDDSNIAPRTSTSAQFLVARRTGVRG